MRSMAWRHEFEPRPWSDLSEFYERMATKDQAFGYLVDIVRSIEVSPGRDRLAATTSMHDLLVVDQPISSLPIEMLRVSAPGSLSPAPAAQWLSSTSLIAGETTVSSGRWSRRCRCSGGSSWRSSVSRVHL